MADKWSWRTYFSPLCWNLLRVHLSYTIVAKHIEHHVFWSFLRSRAPCTQIRMDLWGALLPTYLNSTFLTAYQWPQLNWDSLYCETNSERGTSSPFSSSEGNPLFSFSLEVSCSTTSLSSQWPISVTTIILEESRLLSLESKGPHSWLHFTNS